MERKENRLPIFTERFRKLQGEKSNTEFAEFLGLSRQTVGFYCNGDRLPDAITLLQIAVKCNVSTDYLLGISDFQSRKNEDFTFSDFNFSEKAVQRLSVMSTCKTLIKRKKEGESAKESNVVRLSEQHDMLMKLLESEEFYLFLTNATAYITLDISSAERIEINIPDGMFLDVPAHFVEDIAKKQSTQVIEDLLEKIRNDELQK